MSDISTIERCDNCSRVIGKLEKVYLWQEHPVCGECYARLSATIAPPAIVRRRPPAADNAPPAFEAEHVIWQGRQSCLYLLWPTIFAFALMLLSSVAAIVAIAITPFAYLASGLIAFAAVFSLLKAVIKSRSVKYKITTQRLIVESGFLSRNISEMEWFRLKDVSLDQDFFERLFGIGQIQITSNDRDTPQIVVAGVANPNRIKDIARECAMKARRDNKVLEISQ